MIRYVITLERRVGRSTIINVIVLGGGSLPHVMVVVWSCWMEGSSPLSSWRWCACADIVVIVSPCHGHLVVIARLGGGVVTSIVLELVCTRWRRCRCLTLGICYGCLVVIARLGGGVVASIVLVLACTHWHCCHRLAMGVSMSLCWRGHVADSL